MNQTPAKELSTSEAIFVLHANLPRLEQSLSEIGELKIQVLKKERELEEAIAQNKAALEKVFGSSPEDFQELLKGKVNGNMMTSPNDRKEFGKNGEMVPSSFEGRLTTDEECTPKVYFQKDTNSPLAIMLARPMDETMVADLLIKPKRDELIKQNILIHEELEKNNIEQNRVLREIAEGERVTKELERGISARKKLFHDFGSERPNLIARKRSLETELNHVGAQYCEMNQAVTGISPEESNTILQSIRDDLSSTQSTDAARSPLLQKFVGVLNELNLIITETTQIDLRITEITSGLQQQSRQLEALNEILKSNKQTAPLLARDNVKIMNSLNKWESRSSALESTGRDLIVAMKWGKWASRGLYEPNVSTAPLILLLFRQYCRQQVPFERLKKQNTTGVPPEIVFLRPPGAIVAGMNLSEYVAIAAKEIGYNGEDLRAAGYSTNEICASCILCVPYEEGNPLRYSASQLKQVGYRAGELKRGGYSIEEIHRLGYSLEEMKESGVSPEELRSLRYTANQMKQAGYSPSELKRGGYSDKEIRAAGYNSFQLFLF
jgi:hypothetical protein